jgi:hypothetical protein
MMLMQYILGAAGQNAANARVLASGADRGEYLGAVEHDDHAEFLAGITLVLAGITAVHPAERIDL